VVVQGEKKLNDKGGVADGKGDSFPCQKPRRKSGTCDEKKGAVGLGAEGDAQRRPRNALQEGGTGAKSAEAEWGGPGGAHGAA